MPKLEAGAHHERIGELQRLSFERLERFADVAVACLDHRVEPALEAAAFSGQLLHHRLCDALDESGRLLAEDCTHSETAMHHK